MDDATGSDQPQDRRLRAERYHLQSQVGFQLRVASQIAIEQFSQVYADDAETAKITTSQFAVLAVLWEASDLSQKELARRTSMDMPTLNGLLKRLLSKGLVTIATSRADKRYRVINLTDTGRALAERLRARGHLVTERVLQPLSDKEQTELGQLLTRLIQGHRG
ncbi:MarR family transcriptional regulator [Roseobacter denitrificans]|uniref:Transcriptional regulator, MarR family, putative n=1 Tax=Roseobacter denitrificans (strain ATCC 33942 / OCh 114) TaxID=375451 RepID=Q167A8_ROSDO|nr:MarR family transcriptional regulator [Roseobacter denitrificans]ABG31935.1 transcriptional regulator, MarR family, putative [Roseobacter denitrificans OCh 114]AVL51473.1 MarR family transcriptional regulator [Roseobacter denitrificans]SFG34827.1 transcriptional regulator, MarR family [Roseobacter denitrificans OCh 114]